MPPPPNGSQPAGPVVRTLCVWCPDWPVTVLLAAAAADRTGADRTAADHTGADRTGAGSGAGDAGRPLVVLERGRVLAAAGPARLEGVRRGMRKREAEARCPEARVVERDP